MSRLPKVRSIGVTVAVAAALLLVSRPDQRVGETARRSRSARTTCGRRQRLLEAVQGHQPEQGALQRAEAPAEPGTLRDRTTPQHGDGEDGALFHTANVDVYLHGIQWHTWGENVGYSPGDVAGLEQAFMDSPPHRGNILNRAFRQVAIGSVRVDGTLWVTVFFFG